MTKTLVTVSIILHATEDITKMLHALEIIGTTRDDYTVTTTKGHFDNPILVLNARYSGRAARNIIKQIVSGLDRHQVEQLVSEIPSRTVDSQFHLRLDKQELFAGHISLGDSIKIKIHHPIYDKTDTVATFADILRLK